MKKQLLIATTNKGKVKEIGHFLNDLPFALVSLEDLGQDVPEPEETGDTLEENAILKARYYGEKTQLLTLAEDGGLFIDALDGWPGVKSARFASTNEERRRIVLEKMKMFQEKEERTASFHLAMVLYNSSQDSLYIVSGTEQGIITSEEVAISKQGFGYDPIFYAPALEKTYAEATVREKNSVSHRGKALMSMKYHLVKTYGPQHIVAPLAFIIKNGKILMSVRNDPHRSAFHKKWEFPGGTMEIGEQLEENVIREAKEETGYDVRVITSLQSISVHSNQKDQWNYQVYLIPYVCTIVGGTGEYNDAEVLDMAWFDPEEVLDMDLMGNNKEMYRNILPTLKQKIQEFHL